MKRHGTGLGVMDGNDSTQKHGVSSGPPTRRCWLRNLWFGYLLWNQDRTGNKDPDIY
jgi:hypothetical protein